MIRRTQSRRAKAFALIVLMYAGALVLFAAIELSARLEVRTAQHGPIDPAPNPTEQER